MAANFSYTVWLSGNAHKKSKLNRLTALGSSRTILTALTLTDGGTHHVEAFRTKGETRRDCYPGEFSVCPSAAPRSMRAAPLLG